MSKRQQHKPTFKAKVALEALEKDKARRTSSAEAFRASLESLSEPGTVGGEQSWKRPMAFAALFAIYRMILRKENNGAPATAA